MVSHLESTDRRNRIRLTQGDITQAEVDAIVNAANEDLVPGSGVAGAIHRAGGPEIDAECRALHGHPRCPTGKAVATGAGRLHARHVIHAVAPIWRGGAHGEPDLLASAYRSSLEVAVHLGDRSIGFPSLGTGAFGYPIDQAANVALRTVVEYLQGTAELDEIVFVLFSPGDFATYRTALRHMLR